MQGQQVGTNSRLRSRNRRQVRADLQAGMKLWGSILDVVSIVKDRERIPLFENPRLEELAPQGERFLSILSTALK